MRRVVIAFCSAVLLVGALAPAVTAVKPQHGTGGISFALDFGTAAGYLPPICPFNVHWVEDGSRMQSLTFTKASGVVLTRDAGPQWSVVTNLDTGKSMVVGGGLRIDFVVHPDNTMDVWSNGTVVVSYWASDAPGEHFWVLSGHLHDAVDASGNTVAHSFSGRTVDLCAALS